MSCANLRLWPALTYLVLAATPLLATAGHTSWTQVGHTQVGHTSKKQAGHVSRKQVGQAQPSNSAHAAAGLEQGPGSFSPWPRILAYVLHRTGPNSTMPCMTAQLEHLSRTVHNLGGALHYEFFPVVKFGYCNDGASCMEEAPECFPTRSFGRFINRSYGLNSPRKMFGDWCSRLKLLDMMGSKNMDFEYYLVFQDDIILAPDFATHLMDLLLRSNHYWDLVAMDTFNVKRTKWHDRFSPLGASSNNALPLYSMSSTFQSYQGAHAWVLRAETITRFSDHFRTIPAGPADLVVKVQRPLHHGMWAYQPGAVFRRSNVSSQVLVQAPVQCGGLQTSILMTTRPQMLPRPTMEETQPTSGPVREMILLGMYDSGTKMLLDLIRKNLEIPNRVELCRNYTAWGYCGRIWKHTNPQRVAEFESLRSCPGDDCEKSAPLREAVAVVVVRHPFSLLRSLQKYHYDMDCGDEIPSPLTHECAYKNPPEDWMLTAQGGMPRVPRATCGKRDPSVFKPCWPTLMDAWNSYVDGYQKLDRHFHKVVLLRYEDVVQFPELAVAKVARAVGLPSPDAVSAVHKALGRVQYNVMDRSGSLLKLELPEYGANFTCSELDQVCARLNKNLVFQHGYHGCQRFWPAYDELIRHGATYAKREDMAGLLMALPELDTCVPEGVSTGVQGSW